MRGPPALTEMIHNNPPLEWLSQAMNGRFRRFTLTLSISPQKLCLFHPIYQLVIALNLRTQILG
jgi:hypothetical protein